jgi:hypothetical protein
MAVTSVSMTRCEVHCGPSSQSFQTTRSTPGGTLKLRSAAWVSTMQRNDGAFGSSGSSSASRSGEVTSTRTWQSLAM